MYYITLVVTSNIILLDYIYTNTIIYTYTYDHANKDVSFVFLQVQADVRTIISRDFATRHSLRFPRVERIRYDKSPFDVQTDQELWDLVNQNKGTVSGERTSLRAAILAVCDAVPERNNWYSSQTCRIHDCIWRVVSTVVYKGTVTLVTMLVTIIGE